MASKPTNRFQKGDVVVLKSGGPPMTVDEIPGEKESRYPHDVRDDYHTRWFKGASEEKGDFADHLLDKYEAPAKK